MVRIEYRYINSKPYLKISDSGIGIHSNPLNRIFNHGYTTKENGHGYGLHSCANYMNEMGGNTKIFSDGLGKGASFLLSFTRNKKISEAEKSKMNTTTIESINS